MQNFEVGGIKSSWVVFARVGGKVLFFGDLLFPNLEFSILKVNCFEVGLTLDLLLFQTGDLIPPILEQPMRK